MAKYPSVEWLKGLLILLVIVGHAMEIAHVRHGVLWMGSGFRMPLMVGISGYLLNIGRVRSMGWGDLTDRYGRRMLLPWLVALIVYVVLGDWRWSATTMIDLLLRPPFHLWYVPVLAFLILLTRLVPFQPDRLLLAGAPISLAIMAIFGQNHTLVGNGLLAVDSRYLHYLIYFYFGMVMAQRPIAAHHMPVLLIVGSLAGLWWWSLEGSSDPFPLMASRLLMGLGLIGLLPMLARIRLQMAPINVVGRESLYFYLWHPLIMGLLQAAGMAAFDILLSSVVILFAVRCALTPYPAIAGLIGLMPGRHLVRTEPSGSSPISAV